VPDKAAKRLEEVALSGTLSFLGDRRVDSRSLSRYDSNRSLHKHYVVQVVSNLLTHSVPFGRDFVHQLAFAALAALLWLGAKVLWEINPYFIDDFMAEVRFPAMLTDERSPRPRGRSR
jgi:hypothetical protein